MAISVVLNTYNASKLLPKVLSAVKDFDEIVVCDMESTDDTVEIARKHGARVVTFPKKHYNRCEPARNYAISQARNEWVLVVDADELVTPDLRQYLQKFITKPGNVKGLYIPRKNFILDRFRRSTYPDYNMRFFMRDCVDWPPEIHSKPIIKGEVSKIPSNRRNLALIHIPPTVEGMIERDNRYTSAEADMMEKRPVNGFHLLFSPFIKFISEFIGRGSFRCGTAGLIAAINRSTCEFYRLAKLYEDNVRHKIADGAYGDLPTTVAQEKIRRLHEHEMALEEEENDIYSTR